jgi:tRNA pseudouridine55 synthase
VNEEIILIDKPAGWTSFDVVAKLRSGIRAEYRERGEKPTKRQLKIGHAGTLDPFATGLLIILKGEATKKAGEFLKLDKVYEARITLGRTSTTGDPEGELTDVSDAVPTKDDIERTLAQFVGDITQTPPAFSAIKVNGKRAYALAREGKEVEIPARVVRIYSLELLDYTYPNIRVRAHVGSGTYIRSLAQDIGAALGTGAYCSALRRTSISEWSVDDAGGIN